MINTLKHKLNDAAVLWSGVTRDRYGKGTTFSSITDKKVYWAQKRDLFRNFEGGEVTSKAVVVSDFEFTVGDWVVLGTVAGLDSSQDPHTNNAYQVRGVHNVPSAGKPIQRVYRAFL